MYNFTTFIAIKNNEDGRWYMDSSYNSKEQEFQGVQLIELEKSIVQPSSLYLVGLLQDWRLLVDVYGRMAGVDDVRSFLRLKIVFVMKYFSAIKYFSVMKYF